jgi:putative hydrolase of the HAD superfamily
VGGEQIDAGKAAGRRRPAHAPPPTGRALRPPRAVFFDAAGTLVHPHPSPEAIIAGVLERLAPEALPVDARALAAHLEAGMIARRRAGRLVHYPAEAAREFWRAAYLAFFADRLPPARAAAVADGLLAAFTDRRAWALYPDVRPALAALRRQGLILGLLSNWEEWLDELLVALAVRDAFDHVLVSGELGLEKPDPAIFERALALAGVAPAELVYVGDSLHHDIEPCLALGIRAVLIDRAGRAAASPAYTRLTDLRALSAALEHEARAGE